MSGSQSPYTNAQGTVFPFMGSGDPLATQAYATAADTALTAAAYESTTATATVAGATTGTVTSAARDLFVAVTSSNAAHIVIVPTPSAGRRITLNVGANGFELKATTPTTEAINGGTGAAVSSTIAANSTVIMYGLSATAWKAIFLDADADVAKVEAAH